MLDPSVSPGAPIANRSMRLERSPHLEEAVVASDRRGGEPALAPSRRRLTRMALGTLVLTMGLGACGSAERLSQTTSPDGEVEQRDFRASCTDCSITFGPEVVIGDREDDQLAYPLAGALVDGEGHIIVAEIERIQVFNGDGDIVRNIGRTGDGPGEFRWARGIAVDPMDSLFVFHSRGVLVFDREGEFARQAAFPMPPTRPLRLESGEFLSTTPAGRGQHGSTVYIYDSQWDRRAYGAEVGEMPPNSALAGPVLVGAASGGGFWIAAQAPPFRLERWTSAGELEFVMEPSAGHFPLREHTGIVGAGRQLTATSPYVGAVTEDQEGWLWTSVGEVMEGEEDLPPSGRRVESIIEVRDPRTGDLLGTGRVRGHVWKIQPDGHLLATWEAPTGEYLLIVRHARLEPAGGTMR